VIPGARRAAITTAIGAAITAGAGQASATGPGTFGHGARSAGLAQSDIAGAEASNAAQANAALAATPGFRLRLGYAYGGLDLTINGESAGVRDASGLDLAAQFGAQVSREVTLGLALAAHIPDQYLARVAFRPATEPQFVRYEASLQRMTIDVVGALRYGPVAIGGGVASTLDVGGRGTDFTLGQDANGTYADATTDIELPYHFAPLIGVEVDLGRAAIGAAFHGPLAIDLRLESRNEIALADNPLNGTTTVLVTGASGYDPPLIDFGARFAVGAGLTAFAALEYAVYSAAPAPVADVVLDVRLGTTPGQREARFVEPRLRDTLSPRFGLEIVRPDTDAPPAPAHSCSPSPLRGTAPPDDGRRRQLSELSTCHCHSRGDAAGPPPWRWSVRAGYVLSPSPLPPQNGFTSYADATRHGLALGGGYRFGRVAGVDLSAQLAGQLHLLATRLTQKPSPALPYAQYEVGGHMLYGAASIEGVWR
jgi:hypothetical protein